MRPPGEKFTAANAAPWPDNPAPPYPQMCRLDYERRCGPPVGTLKCFGNDSIDFWF